ncbi:MAG TPA: branched-chain amino acid ABC transporter permease [Candidatus Dormibacteraeota bacterium]|nr:branched-chain amino acid ABC transporter permease [Candidatus Dormibacteraeota bacterium]
MDLIPVFIGFGLVTTAVLAIASVGFTLQYAVTNVLNLAYGEVMTIGALTAYVINHRGGSIWLGLVAGAIASAVASLLLNRFIFGPFARRGLKLFGMVVVAIAVSLIIANGLLIVAGASNFSYRFDPGPTFTGLGMILTTQQLIVIGIAVVAMIAVRILLAGTKLGRAMRATATDESLARACGIPIRRITDIAWLISGALCGIAGVVLGMSVTGWGVFTGQGLLITIVAAAVVGGIGQPYGAMLGALLLGMATTLVAGYFNPQYTDVTAFVILVLFLLFRPQGILADVVAQREVVA